MLKAAPPSNPFAVLMAVAVLTMTGTAYAQETIDLKKRETGFLRDTFDQNVYYDFTSLLRFDRLYREVTGKKKPAGDVNIYDEVPNSNFFTNRHAASRLSEDALSGGAKADGIDVSGKLEIAGGKFDDARPSLVVRNASGQTYVLKFDPFNAPELLTSAEIIANRFYHALGYNTVEETLININPDNITASEGVKVVDSSGFNRSLSKEKLDQMLLSIPRTENAQLRAVVRKTFPAETVDNLSFHGKNAVSAFPGRELRQIRALRVFASWLNQDDVLQGNTLGAKDGKYYFLNFDTALGAGGEGAKPPMYGHEYFLDYGESAKAFFTLGLWEKPWQKRWREAGEQTNSSMALGYIDNRYFEPAKFKTQLPYYAFKDLTRADGFWAAKQIAAFSDSDIRAIVSAGSLTKEDEEFLSKTLMERRDLIVSYWYGQATPLDAFRVSGDTLQFTDLAVERGIVPAGSTYTAEVFEKKGKKLKKIGSTSSSSAQIDLQSSWKQASEIFIRAQRPGASKPNPYVQVTLQNGNIAGIKYQD